MSAISPTVCFQPSVDSPLWEQQSSSDGSSAKLWSRPPAIPSPPACLTRLASGRERAARSLCLAGICLPHYLYVQLIWINGYRYVCLQNYYVCMYVWVVSVVCGTVQKNIQLITSQCVITDPAVTQWWMDAGADRLQNSSSYETSKRIQETIMYLTASCHMLGSI